MAGGIQSFASSAMIGITAVTGAIGLIGSQAMSSASDMQQARVAFETMFGSASKASKLMKDMSDFAVKTPFELPQLVDGAKRLAAYGYEAEQMIPTLKMLGDITAGVGKDKFPALILALGQVKARTTLTGAELRQFTETGVPMLDLLAKKFGTTSASVVDMISNSEVTFADVESVLRSTTQEGGRFFDMMAKQASTFGGVASNIKDQIGRIMRAAVGIDEAGNVQQGSIFYYITIAAMKLLEALTAITPTIVAFIQNIVDKIVAFAQSEMVVTIINGLVQAFTLLGQWVMANQEIVMLFLQALAIAIGGLIIIGTIITLFNMLMNPIFLVIAAITALYMAYQTNFLGIRDLVDAVVNFIMAIVALLVDDWNAHHNEIMATATRIWNVISGFLQVVFGIISMALIALTTLMTGKWDEGQQKINQAAMNVWNGLKTFFSGVFGNILSDVASFVGRFISYLEGLWQKVMDIAAKIKDALSQMSPFHRSSPSLVEYVQMGVADIKSAYKGLEGDISGMMFKDNLMTIAGSYANGQGGGTQAAGTQITQNITQNIGDKADAEFINGQLAFALRTSL